MTDRIAICVSTCRRNAQLMRLLDALLGQRWTRVPPPEIRVVIVDTTPEGAARPVAEDPRWSRLAICYGVESRAGHARTRGVDIAATFARWIALLEDEAIPDPTWLEELLLAQRRSGAAAVAGPVHACYQQAPPAWMHAAGFHDRGATWRRGGTELATASTGNMLFSAAWIREGTLRFDAAGRGGDDRRFFAQARRLGQGLVWANDAIVRHAVPAAQARARWLLQHAFRQGVGDAASVRNALRALAGLTLGVPALLLALPGGRRASMARALVLARGAGALLAGIGLARPGRHDADDAPPAPPPVYVIHMAGSARFEPLRAQLTHLDIPFEILEAIDGRALTAAQLADAYDDGAARRRLGRGMGRGEIGCALSHRAAYARLLERGCAMAIILEEDVRIDASFVAFWRAAHRLPRRIELLSLFALNGHLHRRPVARLARFRIHRAVASIDSAAAYLIRAPAAARLLDAATPVQSVADWPAPARFPRQHVLMPMPIVPDFSGSGLQQDRIRLWDRRPRTAWARRWRAVAGVTGLAYLRHPGHYAGLGNYRRREISPRLLSLVSRLFIPLAPFEPERTSASPLALAETDAASPSPRRPCDAARPAGRDLQVHCLDNWKDLDAALAMLTPGGLGIWDGVAFVRQPVGIPDWTIVLNRADAGAPLPEVPDHRIAIAVGEPPSSYHRALHLGIGRAGIVLTPDEAVAADGSPDRDYRTAPAFLRSWTVSKTIDALRAEPFPEKTRDLSWITSDLATLPGHVQRLQFLDRLSDRLAFDLFGRGFRPIADKWDGLAPYRYSIAFENMRAPYYFTEKLMDCFVSGAMPIYCGSPIITDFFPADAMVRIDPDDPEAVAQIVAAIDSDRRERHLDALIEAKRRVLEEHNVFARLAAFVRSAEPERAP